MQVRLALGLKLRLRLILALGLLGGCELNNMSSYREPAQQISNIQFSGLPERRMLIPLTLPLPLASGALDFQNEASGRRGHECANRPTIQVRVGVRARVGR